jgi:hypothetical protein
VDFHNLNKHPELESVLLQMHDLVCPEEKGPHTDDWLPLWLKHDAPYLNRNEVQVYNPCHHKEAG